MFAFVVVVVVVVYAKINPSTFSAKSSQKPIANSNYRG